jgi:hypothetical protein
VVWTVVRIGECRGHFDKNEFLVSRSVEADPLVEKGCENSLRRLDGLMAVLTHAIVRLSMVSLFQSLLIKMLVVFPRPCLLV